MDLNWRFRSAAAAACVACWLLGGRRLWSTSSPLPSNNHINIIIIVIHHRHQSTQQVARKLGSALVYLLEEVWLPCATPRRCVPTARGVPTLSLSVCLSVYLSVWSVGRSVCVCVSICVCVCRSVCVSLSLSLSVCPSLSRLVRARIDKLVDNCAQPSPISPGALVPAPALSTNPGSLDRKTGRLGGPGLLPLPPAGAGAQYDRRYAGDTIKRQMMP